MLQRYEGDDDFYEQPEGQELALIYTNCASDSGIRGLVVDMAHPWDVEYFDAQSRDWPRDYMAEVLRELVSGRTKDSMDPSPKERCKCHEHEEGGPKCT